MPCGALECNPFKHLKGNIMHQINVYKRLTHKFTLGWSHEDEWDAGTAVKILPMKLVASTDDTETYTQRVIAPSSHRKTDLSYAIASTLSHSGCRHEHDCCGCVQFHAIVRKVSAREYVARVQAYRNY
jgi:hypothetical protein